MSLPGEYVWWSRAWPKGTGAMLGVCCRKFARTAPPRKPDLMASHARSLVGSASVVLAAPSSDTSLTLKLSLGFSSFVL